MILLQVDYLTKVENGFDYIQVELAKDWMIIVQTEMADIDLDISARLCCSGLLVRAIYDIDIIATKLFTDLEHTLFYLSFDLWLQLFLHVVKFKLLPFEVLERIAFLLDLPRL